jgi:hypothetical protein
MSLFHRQIAVTLFVLIAGLTGATAGTERAKAQQTPPPKATVPQIGQFSVLGMERVEIIAVRGNTVTTTVTGNPVSFTSARYDITAPNIKAVTTKGLVSSGIASGGARVVVRQPEEKGETPKKTTPTWKRQTTLTCSTATYRWASEGSPARIDLAGPVKSTSKDPLVNPLDATFESGFIEFVDEDTTRIVLEKPIVSGTAIEKPKPKPEPKKNP